MEYTTRKDYTYKGLPYLSLTNGINDILEAAPDYRYLKVITVTEHHWNHLKKELNVRLSSPYSEYEFIYQNCQGILAAFPKEDYSHYDIVIDTSEMIGKTLLNDLNKFGQHQLYSLEKLIDPNYGGIFDKARTEYIELIHFG